MSLPTRRPTPHPDGRGHVAGRGASAPGVHNALAAYNRIGARLGHGPAATLPAPVAESGVTHSAAVGLMMGVGRVIAFFAPNVATFLQGRGFSAEGLYQLYGVVLVVSAVAVTALHLTYRRGELDATDSEGAIAPETIEDTPKPAAAAAH